MFGNSKNIFSFSVNTSQYTIFFIRTSSLLISRSICMRFTLIFRCAFTVSIFWYEEIYRLKYLNCGLLTLKNKILHTKLILYCQLHSCNEFVEAEESILNTDPLLAVKITIKCRYFITFSHENRWTLKWNNFVRSLGQQNPLDRFKFRWYQRPYWCRWFNISIKPHFMQKITHFSVN